MFNQIKPTTRSIPTEVWFLPSLLPSSPHHPPIFLASVRLGPLSESMSCNGNFRFTETYAWSTRHTRNESDWIMSIFPARVAMQNVIDKNRRNTRCIIFIVCPSPPSFEHVRISMQSRRIEGRSVPSEETAQSMMRNAARRVRPCHFIVPTNIWVSPIRGKFLGAAEYTCRIGRLK
ncbi:hypothetical protein C8R44DRAFT_736098 [Mycena epipterygia]|nr:hypothetical protein C8R44DRAFT_736098 [Mycena epipterygia]